MREGGSDRRRSYRVPVPATAFLWQNGKFCGGYPVSDISLGGCSLSHGPFCDVGQSFDLTVQVPDFLGGGPMSCRAAVVRRGGDRVGMRFVDADPVEDRVHDLVLRCLERTTGTGASEATGHVLLINPRPEHMGPVMRALELQGHRVHLACTPLEAVWTLEHRAAQIGAAVVSLRVGSDIAREFLRHLAERYPSIRRVLLTEDDRRMPAQPDYAQTVVRGPLTERVVTTLVEDGQLRMA